MATYQYIIGVDIPELIKLDQLQDELNGALALTSVQNVSRWGTTLNIVTFADYVTGDDVTVGAVLAAHIPQPDVAPHISAVISDGDGDTEIRLENNPFSDEDVIIIKTDGVDRITFGGINYNSKVFATKDDTGSDWLQHQIGTEGSAYTVMKRSLGTYDGTAALTDGTKVGGYAFALDDGNNGATPQYGAEIAAYALGDQSPTNGGAEILISATRENTKGRQPILTLDADNVQLHQYPDTRDDGETSTALYVDMAGYIRHGTVAMPSVPVTGGKTQATINQSMRWYCYSDDRWVTASDDNYGSSYYQAGESGGTGNDPILEWEHQGTIVRAGETLKRFIMSGRANSSDVEELQFRLFFRAPVPITRFQTGYDSDGEMGYSTIFSENWMKPNDISIWGVDLVNSIQDIHRREAALDFVFPSDGFLSLYVKPTNTKSSTRYFMSTYRLDIESA